MPTVQNTLKFLKTDNQLMSSLLDKGWIKEHGGFFLRYFELAFTFAEIVMCAVKQLFATKQWRITFCGSPRI